jgi:hypothetical protein
MWNFVSCVNFIKYFSGDRIQEHKRGGGMQHFWERTEMCTEFWLGETDGKRALGRRRRRWQNKMCILKCILKTYSVGVDWIDLVQGRDR